MESHRETLPRSTFEPKAIIEMVVIVFTPIALVSSLLFYFGWQRTRVLYQHFGIDMSLVDLSSTDYILRSADVMFGPAMFLIATTVVVGASIGLCRFLAQRFPDRGRPTVIAICAGVFVPTFLVGMWGLFGRIADGLAIWTAISLLISGAAVLVFSVADPKRFAHRAAYRFAIGVGLAVIVAGAFWGASVRATEKGTLSALNIAYGNSRPMAIVYSQRELPIAGAEDMGHAPSPDRPWVYKYEGYRVLTYANGRWFLVWAAWTPNSPTVVLSDDGSVRVDVLPPPG